MNKKINMAQRNYIIVGLCAILVIMAVGYAAFQSQLKISGTSNISSNWSVKIIDIQSKVVSGSPTNAKSPSYTDTTATFKTNLVSPGDTMQYDVTVSNEGNIDAKLDKITVPESANPAIGFEVSGIEEGSLLEAGNTALLTVIVKYNEVTEQPDELTADLKVTLDYSQASNGSESPVTGMTPTDLKALAVTEGDGLYADEYEIGRYIYKGANPNNYITFNNELWRILSIEVDGRIKIIRDEFLSSRAFDSTNSNKWDRPSDIKTYLNGEYLESITVNKEKIEPSIWSIGEVTYNNNDLVGQIADENLMPSQSANVGLITVSEYLRANTNKEECNSLSLISDNRDTCSTTNWLFKGTIYWTIAPYSNSSSSVFNVNQFGNVGSNYAKYSRNVRPVLYLSSDIILNESGKVDNPFTIN